MSSEEEEEYYECTIKRGLTLYHIHPLSIIDVLDDKKEGFINSPMTLGFSELYTIYLKSIRQEYLTGCLESQFITNMDLKLLFVSSRHVDQEKARKLCYDGIVRTEKEYFEVIIFYPVYSLRFIREFNHEPCEILEYPKDMDKTILDAYTKKCKLIEKL